MFDFLRALQVSPAALVIAGGLIAVTAPDYPADAAGNIVSLSDPSRIARVRITKDKSETIRFSRPFAEALVAAPELADVAPLTDQTLYVIGKKAGQTRITVLDKDKKLLGVVDVEVSFDAAGLSKALQQDPQLSGIHAHAANGRILLTGVVPDVIAQSRALAIAEQFAPEAVTNSLSVRSSQQVMLEVRFIEVDRSAARDLGVNWSASGKNLLATGAAGANSLLSNPLTFANPASAALVPLAGIPSSE